MASFTGKSGKCSNFGNCSLADARTTMDVPNGQDFVCTECGKPLLLTDVGQQGGGNSKALAIGALLLVVLLSAGGIGWFLMNRAPTPRPAPSASVEQPKTPSKLEPTAQPPVTGNCSESDERVGLCRRPTP